MPSADGPPVKVALQRISKQFGAQQALSDVNLQLRSGTIHALLGENGAGKTTLMKILYGLLQPTAGQIQIDGCPRIIADPRQAQTYGIGMIHQHFSLIEGMTVLQNVLVGLPDLSWKIDFASHRARLEALGVAHGLEVDVTQKVLNLPPAMRQRVEILKLLYRNSQVLIFDEPTSLLSPPETENLLKVFERLRSAGKTLVFITHKLPEVMAIADYVTVLRRGHVVAERRLSDTNEHELAQFMTSNQPSTSRPSSQISDEQVLSVENLTVMGKDRQIVVKGVSFAIHQHEIFGIAGVSGNGQTELAEAIGGMTEIHEGEVRLKGVPTRRTSVAQRKALGLGYTPGDRHGVAVLLDSDLAVNGVLRNFYRAPFAIHGRSQWTAIGTFTKGLLDHYGVKRTSSDQHMRYLSGGNQQRVVLGRELEDNPHVLVMDNPCHGLDINAVAFVHSALRERANAGLATLYISSELDHLLSICDRIGVMYRGELRAILSRSQASGSRIGRLMAGLEDEVVSPS